MKKKMLYVILLLVLAAIFYKTLIEPAGNQKSRTIGSISLTKVDQQTFKGFKDAMETYGYIENKNIVYLNDGPAGKIENLKAMVQKQLQEGVDLFFVSSTPGALAVQNATMNTAIPVVFCPVNDPVASGIVASLEYPGGNITGIKLPFGEKERFEWLKKIIPSAKRILLPYTPGDKSSEFSRLEAYYAAEESGITLVEEPVAGKGVLADVLGRHRTDVDAIFLPRDSSIESYIAQFVDFADKNRLPLSTPSLQQVEMGALFTYGFVHADMGRQAARIVNEILKGSKPSSLPVETAKNHLVINLDTAKKIGLTLPDTLLSKADRVIGSR
jgi:putative ABC transport system substrate-binding protein